MPQPDDARKCAECGKGDKTPGFVVLIQFARFDGKGTVWFCAKCAPIGKEKK